MDEEDVNTHPHNQRKSLITVYCLLFTVHTGGMLELLGIINLDEAIQDWVISTKVLPANIEYVLKPHSILGSPAIAALAGSKQHRINADYVAKRCQQAYRFKYSGRIDWQNPQAPAFGFPGTAVEFKFTGTSLKLELSEDKWNSGNYIDVYLDDNLNPITIELKPGDEPIIYNIAEDLEDKVHHATVVKRNDYLTGEFSFHGIIIDGQLLPVEPDSKRKIEVYGDSISAGAAVEYQQTGVKDPSGKNYHLSNAYYSYASMLARDYDAELSIIAQSGASLMNGFGSWERGTGAEAFYNKSKPLKNAGNWNFDRYTPDLVIIALGQNDSGTIRIGRDVTAESWKNHYKQLIANLRIQYPNSYFIGMFPNMYHDRAWDDYIVEAIAEYRAEYNDNRVFSLIHEQVTPGHPRISEQRQMADTLKEFIDTTLTDNGFNWDVAN